VPGDAGAAWTRLGAFALIAALLAAALLNRRLPD
jgi:Ca-activated chloride channel family protein